MQSEEFTAELDSGKIGPVYLFLGRAVFLMEEAWRKLLAKLIPQGGRHFNGERVRARETEAAVVIERLATTPMFGGRRLIKVDDVEAWGKDGLEAMANFVKIMPPSACLVMTSSGRKIIEGLAKAVESRGKVVQFKPPAGRDAPRWLIGRAKEMGKTLSPRAAQVLVETAGGDFQTLASELEKICTYVGERELIEAEDIFEAASSLRSFTAFELLDQIKSRQAGKAVRSLRSLLLSGEAPLKLLSTLAWQIRLVWQVKDGLSQGLSEAELAKRLGAHPFAVKKAREQSLRFTDADLYRTLSAIGQTDLEIKSTGTSPEVLLEELVLDLCLEGGKGRSAPRGPGSRPN